jgi:hypothetical protein
MAMMASGTSGNSNLFDDDNNVLDDDFLNDGTTRSGASPATAADTK